MLDFLKVGIFNYKKKEESYSAIDLLNSFLDYLKGIKVFDTVLPKSIEVNEESKEEVKQQQQEESEKSQSGLFPSRINYDGAILRNSSATPCSTIQQPVFKMENPENGVISWSFVSSPDQEVITAPHSLSNENDPLNLKFKSNIPDLPNPEFFDIELNKQRSNETELSVSPSTEASPLESPTNQDSSNEKDHKFSYPCEFCGAEFKIRGYLTRHIKKHALNKAYECPFYHEHSENKCHPTGGFSRRDTYKTHLKARHFKYPKGTKSSKRGQTPGQCASCLKPFSNNENWVEEHIESGACPGLPKGYQVRVKNTRRKHYEFPNATGTKTNLNGVNSPLSLSPNSPEQQYNQVPQLQFSLSQTMTTPISQTPSLPQTQSSNNAPLNNSPLSIVSSNVMSSDKISFESLDFENYEENDEFSLDVEQCLSYRPQLT